VTALLVLLGASVIPASARAAINTNTGVAAIAFGGDLDVFYTGSDEGLWQMSYVPGSGWRAAQETVGGVATSAPAVDVFENSLDVFVRGTDNGVWQRYYVPGTGWSGWGSIGGVATSAPAADEFENSVDVFARGTDNALWQRYYIPGTGWSNWVSLGGGLTSAPAADVFENSVDVFARGGDNGLWQRYYIPGSGWAGWREIPGTNGELASAPSAVVSANGTQVFVFYAGANGGLFDTSYSGATGWTAPAQVPGTAGTVGTAPAAVTYAGSIDVFYLSSNTGLLQVSSPNGVSWQGPVVPAPPTPTPTPAPTPAPAPTSAPAPPDTTPVAVTTIGSSTKKHGSRPRVQAKVMITWKWTSRGTWIERVMTPDFPARGRVTVVCSGPACPLTVSASRRRLGRLWKSLEHHRFRRGDKLMIEITEPGHSAERGQFRIRQGKIPLLKQS